MQVVREPDTRAFFERKAASWSHNYDRGGGMADRVAIFADVLSSRLPPNGTILDFGCGSGDIASHLAAEGWHVTGCDITPEMIAAAKARDPQQRVKWVVLERGLLPFAAAQFDGVIASSVLEYVEDPAVLVAALSAVLKPGGVLVISVPDLRHPLRWREATERVALHIPGLAALLGRTRFAERGAYLRVSRRRLGLSRWAELLAKAGLDVEVPEPCRGPLAVLAGRKRVAAPPADTALPPEDIFGNVKKLKFIRSAIASHRARLGRDIAVLDFGCGNAAALGRYLIGPGIRYFGVDFHSPSLEYARQHFAVPNAQFSSTVPSEIAFDVIVYGDVLEHLGDPLAALAEHIRQLAPNGIVVGSVPNGYGPCETEKFIDRHLRLYSMLRWVKRLALRLAGRTVAKPPSIPYNIESGHVVFFTLRSLRQMVEVTGLRIVRFAHGGFVGADLTGSTIFASQRFINWNLRAADWLPSWAVSTWYFVLAKG